MFRERPNFSKKSEKGPYLPANNRVIFQLPRECKPLPSLNRVADVMCFDYLRETRIMGIKTLFHFAREVLGSSNRVPGGNPTSRLDSASRHMFSMMACRSCAVNDCYLCSKVFFNLRFPSRCCSLTHLTCYPLTCSNQCQENA